MFVEGGSGVRWTLYPPLTGVDFSNRLSIDMLIFSLHILGVSSLFGSINFIVTSFNMKVVDILHEYIPLFVWSIVVTSFLLILTIPVLGGGLTILLLDRNCSTNYFINQSGGDCILFQHLF